MMPLAQPRLLTALPPPSGGRLTVLLIAVMTLLMALALAGGLALDRAGAGLAAGLGRGATVLVVAGDADRATQALAVERILQRAPEIDRASRLGDAEVGRLLMPWLGAPAIERGALPLPVLFDVALRDGADPAPLAERLRTVAPGARIEVHARWMGPLAELLRALRTLAVAVVAVVALATAAVVFFAVRSALAAERDTTRLLHAMGADDAAIAALYQYRYLRIGLAGGAIGVLCAGGVIAGFWGWAAGGAAVPTALALLLVLPLLAGLLAMGAARVAALRALRDLA
jgi:cell division transport system permease protein